MSAAAAGMEIPLPLLRRLKAAGSPGFELNGRCRESRILQFAAEHAELLDADHIPDSYDPLKKIQVEKLKFELAVKRGQYELVTVVKTGWLRAMEEIQTVMKMHLPHAQQFNSCIRDMQARLRALDL